jgi:hypothetical protein
MYRGSSFLLQKDYRIHTYAVRELLKPKYDLLLRLDFDSPRRTEAALEPLLALVSALRDAYVGHISVINGSREEVNVTDTLTTKIVLGTLGCTPAYDRYFVAGLHSKGIPYSKFNSAHFLRLCEFYRHSADEFEAVQRRIHDRGVRYPAMMLVDMYFREVGKQISKRKAAKP